MNVDIQKACDEIFSVEHPNIKVVVLSGSYSDYGQQIISMIQASLGSQIVKVSPSLQ